MNKTKSAQPPAQKTRDKQGRFVKGVKGSGQMGGGRPKLREEFKRFAQEKSLEALRIVYGIMMDEATNQRDRTAAARLMMEYGYGRPAAEYDRERLELDRKRLEQDNEQTKAIEVIISSTAKGWGE